MSYTWHIYVDDHPGSPAKFQKERANPPTCSLVRARTVVMSIVEPLSPTSPEFKGISPLNIIYEAGTSSSITEQFAVFSSDSFVSHFDNESKLAKCYYCYLCNQVLIVKADLSLCYAPVTCLTQIPPTMTWFLGKTRMLGMASARIYFNLCMNE